MARSGIPQLTDYRLCGKSAAVAFSGVFIDSYGRRVGDFVNYSAPDDDFITLADIAGGEVDGDAVGFIISTIDGDLIITTVTKGGGEPDLTDAQAYAPYHASTTTNIGLGQVE
jgi:hypothetical protein